MSVEGKATTGPAERARQYTECLSRSGHANRLERNRDTTDQFRAVLGSVQDTKEGA